MTGDDGLSGLPPERRAFLKRLAMGAAVVVPVVTSFQLGDPSENPLITNTPPPTTPVPGLRHLWQ